ncbi:BTB domain containing protein [Pyrenophora tritici-repentis]|nr:BTB domain-containing protein [Pyrenophora tritici-repentis]KAI0610438.1 BTB domain-containing protein [Pyrenophora tritici-repentis]KAI1541883.1 BTB domain containing protein [Pyrenophora tritici-repentis]KAI1553168.1 BTB domain containing protein [Pyrenophora tritici-repentis]KAI1578651.1 BTB domain containing protein [Pyrenophora tritici-repentis]
MPPITVPCCAPYVPPVFTTNSKDVIFKVGHGSECKEFEVEAALVRACPGCFRDWLKKNQKNPNKEMALPDEKPAVFSVFVAFLKTGTIVIPSDDHDTKDDTDEGRSEDIDKDMNDDVYEERNSDTDDPHTNTLSDEVEDKEDDEGVREMKRLFQEESDARMRDLLKPLPPRERY